MSSDIKESIKESIKNESKKVLSIIYKQSLDKEEQDSIMERTIQYWKNHINEGFLTYRKSVSNEQSYAYLDWADPFQGTSWFIDHRGKKYLDLLGGYGIYNVGRRHPKIISAVQAQLMKQALHSQELLDPLRPYCAYLLSLISPIEERKEEREKEREGGDRRLRKCFFTNSGTESVEACLKIAFIHTGRKRILSTVNAFHVKTLGSLACTYKEKFRGPFKDILCDTSYVTYNSIFELEKIFEEQGCTFSCFILEPIQGEGGIHVAAKEYLQKARELCDQYGVVLIFDEVQCGMGRTGKWWACEHSGVCPDIMAIGKSFGGGIMPVGACIGTDKVWQKYIEQPFLLTTTFGGNPLALSAAIATINVLIEENIIEDVSEKGELFIDGLKKLKDRYPFILKDVRGKGLMIGIEFTENVYGVEFSKRMFSEHVLVAGTLANAETIRIEPSLTITKDEIIYSLEVCDKVLKEIDKERKKIFIQSKL